MIIRLVNLSHKKEEAGCNEETWGLDEAVRRAGSYEAVQKEKQKVLTIIADSCENTY